MTRLLAAALLCAISGGVQATDLDVIAGGWSHHFIPASERDTLNQTQDTLGLELTTADFDLQVSSLKDSFGCQSNQIVGARRWDLFQPKPWFHAGLMLGGIATYRCNAPPTQQTLATEVLQTTGWGGYLAGINFGPGYTSYCSISNQSEQPTCVLMKVSQVSVQSKQWLYGILPGAFMEFGDYVKFELTLLRSPWTGHHLVLYGQFSIKIFSF